MADSSDDEDNIKNYKGVFFNDNTAKEYFEGGAHFNYKDLYNRLNILFKERSKNQSRDMINASPVTDESTNKYSTKYFKNSTDSLSKVSSIHKSINKRKLVQAGASIKGISNSIFNPQNNRVRVTILPR